MATKPQLTRYKEILDELQLQSWQLELVISGFAIFGLVAALEPLFDLFTQLTLKGLWRIRFLVFALYFSCILTIVNLIIHVLLRGLWIGAVGIRSVSGEIDFENLKFSPFITEYLKNKIGTFDTFIEKLETYSSIMFGLTFLVIFITLGVFINYVLFLFVVEIVFDYTSNTTVQAVLANIFALLLFVFYTFIFLDFITRGFFKKKGGKIYLVFYRVASILTLSVLYRPILYNFWDNKMGKRIMLWLLPVYCVGISIFGSKYISTEYFSNYYQSDNQFASRRNYFDMVADKGDYIGYAAIPSKTITTPFLEISIPYEQFIEDVIFEYDSSFKPKKSNVGLRNMVFDYFHWSFGNELTLEQEKSFLNKINEVLITKVNGIEYPGDFIVAAEINEITYLKKYIDISILKNGNYLLTIQNRTSKKDSTKIEHFETIPFWYFKD